MEDSINIQCKDFDINHGNSDAKCFDENENVSLYKLDCNKTLCNLCPYNEKYKNMSYKEWKEFELNNL